MSDISTDIQLKEFTMSDFILVSIMVFRALFPPRVVIILN